MIAPPRQLVLEVAGVCNLRCPQCWTGLRWIDRDRHLMDMDLFNRVVDEAQAFVKHTYLHLWGEPTLNKHLPEMIRRVKQFSTIDLATHALFIDEAMADALAQCDSLSVSIDGVDQETYERYRVGGKFEDAMRGMKLLAAKRSVNWTFVVFKQNEHQIQEAQRIANALGVNLGPKPPLFWDRSKMDETMPTDEKHRRYTWQDGEWKLKADRLKCREFWETIYVLPNGDVITCCYDGGAKYVVGNVWQSSLLDIWNGEKYSQMRRNHEGGTLNPMCHQYCQLPA